ncbi:hypothetical protein TNCV_2979351 [Trichonephila clavipes]|nr:hypothetical protein TNCV_2979351 [Trichonephila clavipes]
MGFPTTSPGSIPGLGNVESAFHSYCSGSINKCQACLETQNTRGLAVVVDPWGSIESTLGMTGLDYCLDMTAFVVI